MMKKVIPILCILTCFHHVTSTNTKELTLNFNNKKLKSFEATNVVKDMLNSIMKLPTQVITNLETLLIRRKLHPEASEVLNAVNSGLDFKLFTIKDENLELDFVEIENIFLKHGVNIDYLRSNWSLKEVDSEIVAPRAKKVTIEEISATLARNSNNKMHQRLSVSNIVYQICESIINPLISAMLSFLWLIIWILVGLEIFFASLGELIPAYQAWVVTIAEMRDFVEATHQQSALIQGADGNAFCVGFQESAPIGALQVVILFWEAFSLSVARMLAPISSFLASTRAALTNFAQ